MKPGYGPEIENNVDKDVSNMANKVWNRARDVWKKAINVQNRTNDVWDRVSVVRNLAIEN